jgi:fluoride exporter
VLWAISAGGGLGGGARFGLGEAFPAPPDGFPWVTFGVNVSGCLLIGIVMVLASDVWPDRRLLRPFLGVGVLGGYTTFSFHVHDAYGLWGAGATATAAVYVGGTAVTALLAVFAGVAMARRLARRHRRCA